MVKKRSYVPYWESLTINLFCQFSILRMCWQFLFWVNPVPLSVTFHFWRHRQHVSWLFHSVVVCRRSTVFIHIQIFFSLVPQKLLVSIQTLFFQILSFIKVFSKWLQMNHSVFLSSTFTVCQPCIPTRQKINLVVSSAYCHNQKILKSLNLVLVITTPPKGKMRLVHFGISVLLQHDWVEAWNPAQFEKWGHTGMICCKQKLCDQVTTIMGKWHKLEAPFSIIIHNIYFPFLWR